MHALKYGLLVAAGCLVAGLAVVLPAAPPTDAADHGDSPLLASDAGADMADFFLFLDPADNNRVVAAFDVRGFIAPGENENSAVFDPDLQYRFAFETTGDALADVNIEVSFAPKTGPKGPQTATIGIRGGPRFTAPTTPVSARPTEQAVAPVVTTDPNTGIRFFAGLTDDPFFFDIPAELDFRDSLITTTAAGATQGDFSVFNRALDSFAGFNVLMIAISVPKSLVTPATGTKIGASGYTERRQRTKRSRNLGLRDKGSFIVLDRMGIPAINTVLVPFARKDEYNRGTTTLDAAGVFATDIVGSLTRLGTNATNIDVLANLAVLNGDILRLDLNVANSGPDGGNNAGAGFPNGRRPSDDVIDVVVNLIANRDPFAVDSMGNPVNRVDNVNVNDKDYLDVFPFFAAPHQPVEEGD